MWSHVTEKLRLGGMKQGPERSEGGQTPRGRALPTAGATSAKALPSCLLDLLKKQGTHCSQSEWQAGGSGRDSEVKRGKVSDSHAQGFGATCLAVCLQGPDHCLPNTPQNSTLFLTALLNEKNLPVFLTAS